MEIPHKSEVIRDAFGQSIYGLFAAVCGWNPSMKLSEQRESFFFLLEKLLEDGRVRFIAPGADCYISTENPRPKLAIEDQNAQWHAPVGEIMAFVRNRWPAEVNQKNDLELTYYFYELPGLIWVDKDGKLVAS